MLLFLHKALHRVTDIDVEPDHYSFRQKDKLTVKMRLCLNECS